MSIDVKLSPCVCFPGLQRHTNDVSANQDGNQGNLLDPPVQPVLCYGSSRSCWECSPVYGMIFLHIRSWNIYSIIQLFNIQCGVKYIIVRVYFSALHNKTFSGDVSSVFIMVLLVNVMKTHFESIEHPLNFCDCGWNCFARHLAVSGHSNDYGRLRRK